MYSKSASQSVFGQKKWNAKTLKAIVCQTAPLAKLPPDGFLFIHEICRHEIFPEFFGIPEFSRPQKSFSWKSQIRFNICVGGGGLYFKLWLWYGSIS